MLTFPHLQQKANFFTLLEKKIYWTSTSVLPSYGDCWGPKIMTLKYRKLSSEGEALIPGAANRKPFRCLTDLCSMQGWEGNRVYWGRKRGSWTTQQSICFLTRLCFDFSAVCISLHHWRCIAAVKAEATFTWFLYKPLCLLRNRCSSVLRSQMKLRVCRIEVWGTLRSIMTFMMRLGNCPCPAICTSAFPRPALQIADFVSDDEDLWRTV